MTSQGPLDQTKAEAFAAKVLCDTSATFLLPSSLPWETDWGYSNTSRILALLPA
jgi:hypothetical protein